MSQAGLFENIHARDFKKSLNVLNGLMTKYAGGYIEKLRPSPNNALEFRISPSAGGPSFTFDGLSSGQKEIISTLFLIWINTKARPGIVLIDEPELHLNPEWQSGFVNYLNELVPANQYIIATHSEDIFRSVERITKNDVEQGLRMNEIKPVTGIPFADDIRQSAKHTLFVEGKFDAEVLKAFFVSNSISIQIEILGPSLSVSSAAEALHPYHPYYYFIVDRDLQNDSKVNASWQKFPDPETNNLLIWKKREIENYFLDPEYICKSQYLNCKKADLKKHVITAAKQRVFLDAANIVIIKVREEIREKWIETFKSSQQFRTKVMALKQLLARDEFRKKRERICQQIDIKAIEKLYENQVSQLLGGRADINLSQGKWLEMMEGKEILKMIGDKCFKVRTSIGRFLEGEEKVIEVAKDLVRKHISEQPDDFQGLLKLVADKIKKRG